MFELFFSLVLFCLSKKEHKKNIPGQGLRLIQSFNYALSLRLRPGKITKRTNCFNNTFVPFKRQYGDATTIVIISIVVGEWKSSAAIDAFWAGIAFRHLAEQCMKRKNDSGFVPLIRDKNCLWRLSILSFFLLKKGQENHNKYQWIMK